MKKTVSVFLSLIAMSQLMGCAHVHPVDGPQEKTEIPAGFRVRIGSMEIKEGDRLNVFDTTCQRVPRSRGGTKQECHTKQVGEATVLKVLDHDSAIVQPEHDLKMDSSMKVEKQ